MKVTIITPAHNEGKRIGHCIRSVQKLDAPNGVKIEHVVVLDRCTDNTRDVCEDYGVKVLVKNWRGKFVNPIAEAMSFALKSIHGDLIMKVDADIQVTRDTLVKLLPYLKENVVCVSTRVKSRTGKKYLDFLMWMRDLSFRIAPLGRKVYGACMLFRRDVVEEIGGFDVDAPRWDTGYELKLGKYGYETKVIDDATVLEHRETTVRRLVERQISDGKARRKLRIGFLRTLLHAVFRGRPFVLWGYLIAKQNR